MSGPPRALEWRIIQQLLRSIKRTDQTGWRDFMVLHLMAHYGLSKPVRSHGLKIDFDQLVPLAHFSSKQVKTHSWLTLPLMDQTPGSASALPSRRATAGAGCRELFLCAFPPARPMTKVKRQFRCSRVRARPERTAHRARLGLRPAPFFLRCVCSPAVVGVKAIGDLMGHHSLASTSVYLRLQSDVLRESRSPGAHEARSCGRCRMRKRQNCIALRSGR